MPGERRGASVLEHLRHGVQLQAAGQLHFPVLYAQAGRHHLHRHAGGRHRGLCEGQTGLAQGRRQDRRLDREARRSHLHAHLKTLALLRACRARPRTCRAAEKGDERATLHSITSSARKRIDVGNTIPKLLAVFRLMTSSNGVANSAGTSAGLAPRSTLATRAAPCRKVLSESTPYEIIPPARAKSGNSETAGSRSASVSPAIRSGL